MDVIFCENSKKNRGGGGVRMDVNVEVKFLRKFI